MSADVIKFTHKKKSTPNQVVMCEVLDENLDITYVVSFDSDEDAKKYCKFYEIELD